MLGELILVSVDAGEYFLGHLYDGSDLLAEKKVRADKIAPTSKKGNVYKRVPGADMSSLKKVCFFVGFFFFVFFFFL